MTDLEAYEQGFRRAGLPAFIAELSGAVDLRLSFVVNAVLVLAAVSPFVKRIGR